MKTLKILMLTLALFAGIGSAAAALTGEWKHYPSFDIYTNQLVDTPTKVYFTVHPQRYDASYSFINDPGCSFYVYDKEGDELRTLTQLNDLSEPLVQKIAYNPDKKYLLVVYNNLNIDFFYDDGRIVNMGALMNLNLPGSKDVGQITFAPEFNQAFIPTDFGYVCLDDVKHEVAESRNFGQKIWSVVRVGDRIVMAATDKTYAAMFADARFNLSDYEPLPYPDNTKFLYPVDSTHFITVQGNNVSSFSYSEMHELKAGTLTMQNRTFLSNVFIKEVVPTAKGCMLLHKTGGVGVSLPDRKAYGVNFPSSENNTTLVSYDEKTWWKIQGRKGLMSYLINNGAWTVSHDYMLPNSPAVYLSYSMAYHPKYGTLVASRGVEGRFVSAVSVNIPYLMSGLKNGEWTEYSPTWNDPNHPEIATDLSGLAIDPDDNDWIYRGSRYNGIVKVNLKDPTKTLHMSRPNDPDANHPDFVPFVENQNYWSLICNFHRPQFDANGNLISFYTNDNEKTISMFRWSPENRKASVSKATYRPWDRCELPFFNYDVVCFVPKHPNNANKVIVSTGDELFIVDHKGTFDNSADDTILELNSAVNQDGTAVAFTEFYAFHEDPETGLIWVGSRRGLFTVNLRTVGQTGVVNQVKVSRDDGTSLADYLLNEVSISNIMDDGQGRKWFSTNGGGVVATTSDGRKILAEFTKENSQLPDNIVYSTCYNPETNSVMMSTDSGLCEFFLSGASGASAGSEVRAYPNPVAPDYYGYVTIDGLADNVLVKIMDSNGGIVRDLGIAENGSVQWDVMNMNFKRVRTGVYYIMVSGGPDSDAGGAVGKILVMN